MLEGFKFYKNDPVTANLNVLSNPSLSGPGSEHGASVVSGGGSSC